jgi:hypothetical protein
LHTESSRSSIPSEVSPLLTPSKSQPLSHSTSSESLSVSGKRTPRDQDLPETPLIRSSSQPHQAEAPVTPVTPASRNNLSLIMPGPLSSPFSSLTAVVADELRRGVEGVPSPNRKRLGGSLRTPRSSSRAVPKPSRSARKAKSPHTVGQGDTVGSEEMTVSRSQQTPPPAVAEEPGPVKRKMRKLSATLGDLARRKRAKSAAVREQSDGEEENGR